MRKTTITTRVLELIHQVVSKRIHITKRDLFYTDVKLFSKQEESDAVLDDIACMVGCTRTSLNVVASDKGVVVGRVTFLEDGDFIDCTKMGVGGKAIPALVHKITDVKVGPPCFRLATIVRTFVEFCRFPMSSCRHVAT